MQDTTRNQKLVLNKYKMWFKDVFELLRDPSNCFYSDLVAVYSYVLVFHRAGFRRYPTMFFRYLREGAKLYLALQQVADQRKIEEQESEFVAEQLHSVKEYFKEANQEHVNRFIFGMRFGRPSLGARNTITQTAEIPSRSRDTAPTNIEKIMHLMAFWSPEMPALRLAKCHIHVILPLCPTMTTPAISKPTIFNLR